MKPDMIGIIGGTGLDSFEGFDAKKDTVDTPYGIIELMVGKLQRRDVVFAPRHEFDHRYPPNEVNYRGIVSALKMKGCKRIIGFSSVGSLDDKIAPGSIVIPEGWFLYNVFRPHTFFEGGFGAIHVNPEPPLCDALSDVVEECSRKAGYDTFRGGAYLNIQGPCFLTALETRILTRNQPEMRIIGMSLYPEALLAREAEMCYTMIAFVTDYNKLPGHPEVSAEEVMKTAEHNTKKALVLLPLILKAYKPVDCACGRALNPAVQKYIPERAPNEFVKCLVENAIARKG